MKTPIGADAVMARLQHCTSLPSPPGIAVQLIGLCEDPDVEFDQFLDIVAKDPALTARLLRLANSPVYGGLRRTTNLRQALVLFGINGILNLALSFALTTGLGRAADAAIDQDAFWRRSLTVAVAARQIGKRMCPLRAADLYLAGLLQDLGILAIGKAFPDLYRRDGRPAPGHAECLALERAELAIDHALAGAWLLQRWNLPDWLVATVALSHRLPPPDDGESGLLARCVSAASGIADLMRKSTPATTFRDVAQAVRRSLAIDEKTLLAVMESVGTELESTMPAFEIDLGDDLVRENLAEHAAELLQLRTLRQEKSLSDLRRQASELEWQTRLLQEKSTRDSLTGLYNREHFDRLLDSEFDSARRHGWPLSVLFVDLDDFKQVNDRHGHQNGDEVLIQFARILGDIGRDGDLVARYGGEEFVALLPGTDAAGAARLGRRIVDRVRETRFRTLAGAVLSLTTSVGAATDGPEAGFDHGRALVDAADRALYAAKHNGKGHCVSYVRNSQRALA